MSLLDQIADTLSETEFSEKEASKLYGMMKEYREKYHRTFHHLYRIPGFRKLWDAIDEAVRYSCSEGREELEIAP